MAAPEAKELPWPTRVRVFAAAVTAYRHVLAKDPESRWTWTHTCRVVRRHVEARVASALSEAAREEGRLCPDMDAVRHWSDRMAALARHVLRHGWIPDDDWKTWEQGQAEADRRLKAPEPPMPERHGVATYLPEHGHYVWIDADVLMAAPALRRGGYDPLDASAVDEDEAEPEFVAAARQHLGAA